MRDEVRVIDLVTQARDGEKQAWDAIVDRYSPLIWSICRRHRLGGADAEDVGQAVWLLLVSQLGQLRDPHALPGWLATTTRRECGRVLRTRCRLPESEFGLEAEKVPDGHGATPEDELLLAERNATLCEAFARLPADDQRLLALLMADPPVRYAEISARLGIPVGSIGPFRGRCLDKLRRDPAIAALAGAGAGG
jgi:RNA polymerase sigma factor (sigma-70 family)